MKRGSRSNRLLDRYVGIPTLYATSLLRKHGEPPDAARRIGVMASPTLGDTILNSAVLYDIKSRYPDSHLIYFASKTNGAAVELLPCVDEIVSIIITNPLKTIRRIRKQALDILFDFTPWQRLTAFYAAYAGARFTVGFRSPGQYRHWHYDLTADHSQNVHEIENFRGLVRKMGIEPTAEPGLNLPKVPTPDLGTFSEAVVFHPWASGELRALREWPLAKWIELARQLNGEDTIFIITGSPSDRDRSDKLRDQLIAAGLRSTSYISPDGLVSLSALLMSVDLVVSVNTGTMHLAAVLGSPTIALNGPTATHRWGPIGKCVASVEPRGGGGGYLHFGFEFAGNPKDCMERIEVEDVLQTAKKLVPGRLSTARLGGAQFSRQG